MKIFKSIYDVKNHYLPLTTEKEREDEFLRIATPKEIGIYWAEHAMEKVRQMFHDEKKKLNNNNVVHCQ